MSEHSFESTNTPFLSGIMTVNNVYCLLRTGLPFPVGGVLSFALLCCVFHGTDRAMGPFKSSTVLLGALKCKYL